MIRSRSSNRLADRAASPIAARVLLVAAATLSCTPRPQPVAMMMPTGPTRPPATLTAAAATDALSNIAATLQTAAVVVDVGATLAPRIAELPEPCRTTGQVDLIDLADADGDDQAIGPALVMLVTPADYDPCAGDGFPVVCAVAMVEVGGNFRLAATELEHDAGDRLDIDAGPFTRGQRSDGEPCRFLALEFGSQPQCGDGGDYTEEQHTQIFSYQNGTFEPEQTLLERAIEHGELPGLSYQAELDWVDVGDQSVLVRQATRTTFVAAEAGDGAGDDASYPLVERTVVELDLYTIDPDCHLIAADEAALREADTEGVLPPPDEPAAPDEASTPDPGAGAPADDAVD